MSALNSTLASLLALAEADDAAAIWPVNQAIDAYTERVGGSLDDRIFALIALREAFERKAPRTELATYAMDVMDNRRRILAIAWWEAHRAGRLP